MTKRIQKANKTRTRRKKAHDHDKEKNHIKGVYMHYCTDNDTQLYITKLSRPCG